MSTRIIPAAGNGESCLGCLSTIFKFASIQVSDTLTSGVYFFFFSFTIMNYFLPVIKIDINDEKYSP